MRVNVVVIGLLVALVTGSLARRNKCITFWTEYNGSCYTMTHGVLRTMFGSPVYHGEGRDQAAANKFCAGEKTGATLVTINNALENKFLYEWVLRSTLEPKPVWIGLHVNPFTNTWEWYSGEPVTYTNWDEVPHPIEYPYRGAILFDADLRNQAQGTVDVSERWVTDQALGEVHFFICEYALPQPTKEPPTAATNTTQPAMMLNNRQRQQEHRPLNFMNLLSGRSFGGSQLHEIHRGQRPAAFRNNYYGVMP